MAFVVIDCAPGVTAQVAQALSAHPHMLTIERAAASHTILAIVPEPTCGACGTAPPWCPDKPCSSSK